MDKLGTCELAYFHRLSDSDGHEKNALSSTHLVLNFSFSGIESVCDGLWSLGGKKNAAGRWAACKMFMESCLVQLGDLRHMNNNPLDASRLAKFCLLLQIE